MHCAMSARFIIDGYNLLYAMGLLGDRTGPHGLEKARSALLGLLHGSLSGDTAVVTVVFDSASAAPGSTTEDSFRGIRVLFAPGKLEADDVIEGLIRKSSTPKTLHVVSNDHRVQRAARGRGCQVRDCEDFLAWLERQRNQKSAQGTEPPEKKEHLSENEVERWLAEFGRIESDPSLRKAFESYDFEKHA
jgi:predicted RNA-binding protein with PIN domain